MKQSVTLKGSGDGYLLQLNDHAAYSNIIEELETLLIHLNDKKHTENDSEENNLLVTVQTGNRLLSDAEKDLIKERIEEKDYLKVKKFESNVIDVQNALTWHEKNQTTLQRINCSVRNKGAIRNQNKGQCLIMTRH